MIQPTNRMELKKKEDQSVNSSIPYRRGNKIITGDRGREEPGRERGGRGEKEGTRLEKVIGRDRREVQRVRKFNRNL